MTERIRIIDHGILLLDLSNIREPHKEAHLTDAARKLIARQPVGEALVLTDITGSNFSDAAIDALTKLAERNRPFVKASALVGLSPLTRVIFRAVVALTRRDIRTFATREEAIVYLLSHRAEDVPPLPST